MAIGKAGAKNAAIFAAQILGGRHSRIRDELNKYRANLAYQVDEKAEKLERRIKGSHTQGTAR
jgi:phosphoribosylcarboxyaminoimidazole (NCAIR) mutase